MCRIVIKIQGSLVHALCTDCIYVIVCSLLAIIVHFE